MGNFQSYTKRRITALDKPAETAILLKIQGLNIRRDTSRLTDVHSDVEIGFLPLAFGNTEEVYKLVLGAKGRFGTAHKILFASDLREFFEICMLLSDLLRFLNMTLQLLLCSRRK